MFNNIEQFARDHFAKLGWLDRSGAFVYTSPDSIRPGRTMIVGTNPGGSVETHAEETLRVSLAKFAQRPPGWSAWFHEGGWGSTRTYAQQGSAPLQKDVARVLALLGHPADVAPHVCSTELIFLRSQHIGKLDADFNKLAQDCWPINVEILRAVQPRQLMIIGNGENNSPWSFLRDKFASSWTPKTPIDYGRGKSKLKAADFQFDGRTVSAIGFPHFSRFGVPNDLGARLKELGLPNSN